MAIECGWTKDYIADNLTVAQILRYCEIIERRKIRDVQLYAVSTLQAVGAAFGTVKIEDFRKYIKLLTGNKETPEEFNAKFDEAKNKGLNIEDH